MKPTLETIALIFSLLTFAGGIVAWYSAAVIKRYAAQRDFDHLQRNYQQMAASLADLEKEIDHRGEQINLVLADLKSIGMAIYTKVSDGSSMGWQRRRNDGNDSID